MLMKRPSRCYRFLLGLSIFIAVIAGVAVAAPEQASPVQCPSTVTVKDQELAQAPADWTVVHAQQPHRLAGVTFYEGPPEQEASLAPDSRRKITAQKETQTWRFLGPGIWIACSYSATDLALAQPLPKNTSSCTVTYNPQVSVAGYPEIQKIACTAAK
jgi:hypothetical protein